MELSRLKNKSKSSLSLLSLEPQIKQSTNELGTLLSKVKGAGQVSLNQPSQRNIIQDESDMILRPLMDFLVVHPLLIVNLVTQTFSKSYKFTHFRL